MLSDVPKYSMRNLHIICIEIILYVLHILYSVGFWIIAHFTVTVANV